MSTWLHSHDYCFQSSSLFAALLVHVVLSKEWVHFEARLNCWYWVPFDPVCVDVVGLSMVFGFTDSSILGYSWQRFRTATPHIPCLACLVAVIPTLWSLFLSKHIIPTTSPPWHSCIACIHPAFVPIVIATASSLRCGEGGGGPGAHYSESSCHGKWVQLGRLHVFFWPVLFIRNWCAPHCEYK